jgi:hypothetical protein
MTYMEEKYACSGICDHTLFWVSKPLTEGRPMENCLEGMKQEVRGNVLYVGVTALLCGIFMFLVWVFQYCLWRSFPDE